MRVGEAQNPGPADHERDGAQEEPCPRRTINEAGGRSSRKPGHYHARNSQSSDCRHPSCRSRRGNRCNHCRADTATRDILVGDVFQDRRQPRHRDAAASQSNPHQSPLARNQFRQEIPWMTLHSQTAQFGTLLLNVTRSCSVTSAGPHRRPFLAALSPAVPPLGQKAQKGALSLVPNPGPCCADTAAVYC